MGSLAQEHEVARLQGLLTQRDGELAELHRVLEELGAAAGTDEPEERGGCGGEHRAANGGEDACAGDGGDGTILAIARQCVLQLAADVKELRSCVTDHASDCSVLVQAGEQTHALAAALQQSLRSEQAEVERLRGLLVKEEVCV